MSGFRRTIFVMIAFFPALVLAEGEVVDYVEAMTAMNPAPSTPLKAFDRFEIAPIGIDSANAKYDANLEAQSHLQTNLDERATPLLKEWNAVEAKHSPPRVLKIEPEIRAIKFIPGKARFWAGAFAGGSAILIAVKMTDAQSGELIAEPEFYQHANKMGAAWSFGATDRAMLVRETDLIADYLKGNYSEAVGGPTGKPEKSAKK